MEKTIPGNEKDLYKKKGVWYGETRRKTRKFKKNLWQYTCQVKRGKCNPAERQLIEEKAISDSSRH